MALYPPVVLSVNSSLPTCGLAIHNLTLKHIWKWIKHTKMPISLLNNFEHLEVFVAQREANIVASYVICILVNLWLNFFMWTIGQRSSNIKSSDSYSIFKRFSTNSYSNFFMWIFIKALILNKVLLVSFTFSSFI